MQGPPGLAGSGSNFAFLNDTEKTYQIYIHVSALFKKKLRGRCPCVLETHVPFYLF